MRYIVILLIFFTFNLSGQDLKVGDTVPDITMEGLNGQIIKLSSLRGKVVLVDFWASWCKPCRKENPEIVKIYEEYQDQEFKNGNGFTVFSVSLDMKHAAWEKAVTADNLTWKYHVSDLKGWDNAAAREYGVSAIPQSYLIDGNGRVIAVNPRGGELEKELRKFRKRGISLFDFLWFSEN